MPGLSRLIVLLLLVLVLVSGCSSPEEKVAGFVESGNTLFEQGDYVKADLEYRNALQINQNLVEAWYGLAQVAEKQANWEKTYKLLNKVVELEPKHVEAHITLGKINLAAQQIDKALEESDLLLTLAPDNADVRALRGAVLYRLSDTDGAKREANLALEKDPGNVDALLILATERLAAEDATAAIEYLDRGIERHEKNIALLLIKVEALNQLKELDRAVKVFNRLIEFYPDNKTFRHSLARLYIVNNKVDEAEAIFHQLVEQNPTEVDAKLDVVRFLLQYRDAARTESQLLDYIKDSPEVNKLRFSLADFYLQNKQSDKAGAVYKEVIAKSGDEPDGLQAKNRLALMALAAGDKSLAKTLIGEVLAVEARNSEALIMKANLALEQRATDDAIADLRSVLRDEPDSVNALVLLAKAHLQAGSLEQAKDQYIKAIRANPGNAKVALEYALLLIKNQQIDLAEEVLQDVLTIAPRNLLALQAMAQVKITKQDWAAAQGLAEQIRTFGGEEALYDQIMGVTFQGQKQYEEGIAAFKRAHQASPTTVQPLVALVRTYVRSGKIAEAERFLKAVLKSHEDNIFAHVLLGRLYFLNKKPEQAEQSFRLAVKTNPDNELGYRSLASLYIRDGKLDEARKTLEQGLVKIPADLALRISLAGVHEQAGEYEQAISLYEAILKENPNVDVAANNLASLLSEYRGDQASMDRALALAERFSRSKIPYFQDTLGWIYHQMGKDDEATPFLEEAVEALPAFPVFHYHLGMSYLASGQKQKAKQELEKAISLSESGFPGVEKAREILDGL